MNKTKKISYWVATIWLALGMTSTAIVQLMQTPEEIERIHQHLGYPVYFLNIIGIWKLLGVIAVLVPRFTLIKEWAYAGFFFAMSGAVYSHIAAGSAGQDFFGPILLLVLTVLSWYLRPDNRKTTSTLFN